MQPFLPVSYGEGLLQIKKAEKIKKVLVFSQYICYTSKMIVYLLCRDRSV